MKYAIWIFYVSLIALVGGCGVAPLKPEVAEKTLDRDVYALVRGAGDATAAGYRNSAYCSSVADPACSDIANYDAISVAINRDWKAVRLAYMLVPKSAHVEAEDIIVFHSTKTGKDANRFIRIAAKAADKPRLNCDWVGSKILTDGGVECEGWSYKNDPVRGGAVVSRD